MRKLYQILIFILFSRFAFCQTNLVPNPSFELYNQCPFSGSQSYEIQNWTNFGGTPDYLNTCVPTLYGVSVPENFGGFQEPFSGNAYVTLSCWNNSPQPNFREFIGTKLIDTLIVGTKYFVSMKVAPCFRNPNEGLGFVMINNFGFSFTREPLDSTIALATNNCQVYTSNVITDTILWTTVKGSFIADSAFIYLSLGNFMADSLTSIDTNYISGYNMVSKEAYYYFDHICVTDDSLFNEEFSIDLTNYKQNNTLKVFPNPVHDYFEIEKPTQTEIKYIEIFDSIGQLVSKQDNGNNNLFKSVNLLEGIYILKVYCKNNFYVINKLLKQSR